MDKKTGPSLEGNAFISVTKDRVRKATRPKKNLLRYLKCRQVLVSRRWNGVAKESLL